MAQKEVTKWTSKHRSLLKKIALLISSNQRPSPHVGPSPPVGGDGHVTSEELIDTTWARKQSGPEEIRGTFVDAVLFPVMARYISDQFALYTDSITARYITGDYAVVKDVIRMCDSFNGERTQRMHINMDVDDKSLQITKLLSTINSALVRNNELSNDIFEIAKLHSHDAKRLAETNTLLYHEVYPQRILSLPVNVMFDDPCCDQDYGRTMVKHVFDDMARLLQPVAKKLCVCCVGVLAGDVCGLDILDAISSIHVYRGSVLSLQTMLYKAVKLSFNVACATHITWRQLSDTLANFNLAATKHGVQGMIDRTNDLNSRFASRNNLCALLI